MERKGIALLVTSTVLLTCFSMPAYGQSIEERLEKLEKAFEEQEATAKREEGADTEDSEEWKAQYKPKLRGILRGKYEYSPDLNASRFEVRNARISLSGSLPLRSVYKIEIDLCDETEIKMKDCWVGLLPAKDLRLSIGQQRLPFTIDAHRNPSEQFFSNRSFIGKQVGDVRDVGVLGSYSFKTKDAKGERTLLAMAGGIFNGSNITEQRDAWHKDINYSARILFYPVRQLAIVPSIQHTAIADRKAHYTSVDIGVSWHSETLHLEAEYLRKNYSDNVFKTCPAVNSMAIYRMPIRSKSVKFFDAISLLARYDYMGDHSDGKKGFATDNNGNTTSALNITDYKRHRMTLGTTFHIANKVFATDLRINYEKYWYPDGGKAKEGELDKLVCEVAICF